MSDSIIRTSAMLGESGNKQGTSREQAGNNQETSKKQAGDKQEIRINYLGINQLSDCQFGEKQKVSLKVKSDLFQME